VTGKLIYFLSCDTEGQEKNIMRALAKESKLAFRQKY